MARTTAKSVDLTYGMDPAALLRATAFHEAGHAVVGYHFRKWIRDPGISVARDQPGNGHVAIRGEIFWPLSEAADPKITESLRRRLRTECMEYLAGFAAEAREMRIRGLLGAGHDWQISVELVRLVEKCDVQLAMFTLQRTFLPAVRRLLRDDAVWKTVGVLAEALIARGALSGDEAQKLLEASAVRRVPTTYWSG